MPHVRETAPATFTVSGLEALLVSDGRGGLPPEVMFASAPPGEREAAVEGLLDDQGRVPAPFHSLLVRAGTTTVLVDAGLGPIVHPFGSDAGHLLDALAATGVQPDDVDLVIITHAHPDHIGGLVRGDHIVFGRATHVISATERAFWHSDSDVIAGLPPVMASIARDILGTLAAARLLDEVDDGAALLSGIRLTAAPGHTPGQVAVELGDAADGAFFLADAVVHPLHFEHPDWVLAPDTSPEDVAATRMALGERAVREGRIVTAAHLETAGTLERAGAGFRFSARA
jgi:glyoxylase-like metal-dependent hydrolase (beta-lactamase superfamily II)